MVEVESKQGAVVWSSTQIRLTPFLSSSLCQLGVRSNGTSLRRCMWKRRDSGVETFACSYGRNDCGSGPLWRHPNPAGHCIKQEQSCPRIPGAALFWIGQCHALGCTHVRGLACGSAPGCFSPPGNCIGNVWGFAHSTVTLQNASCLVN